MSDTIAAIATAPGCAGVAIVRISGPDAFAVAGRVAGRTPKTGMQFVRTPLDECVVLGFRGPKSYTGEDVVEFQCHGGSVTPRRILEAACASGARLARRGEFTERAFLSGRIGLDQAESVLDLINAKTDRAADAALEGLSGRRQSLYRGLYERTLDLSTRLEHALDVSEDELPPSFYASVAASLAALREEVSSVLKKAREGKILREGALVVLAGPPNAGKSSLLNALLGENRAIVSDVPGTTRDTIEEWMDLEGFPVRLVDTAGLRETKDAIEAEGVRRAEDLVAKADVVLLLGDGEPADGRTIRLHAKCDLGHGAGLNVSARTGEGLAELRARIVAALRALNRDGGDATPSERAQTALLEVRRILDAAEVTSEGTDLVLAANALRTASETLARLIGAAYSSDLLENLFSRFCVGK